MDYQILVNIAVGVITLLGGWVFKMILGTLNEIKGEHHDLMKNHHADIDKLREKHTALALALPKEYVSKDENENRRRKMPRFCVQPPFVSTP